MKNSPTPEQRAAYAANWLPSEDELLPSVPCDLERTVTRSDLVKLTAAVRKMLANWEETHAIRLHTPIRDFTQRDVTDAVDGLLANLLGS